MNHWLLLYLVGVVLSFLIIAFWTYDIWRQGLDIEVHQVATLVFWPLTSWILVVVQIYIIITESGFSNWKVLKGKKR